MVFHCYPTMFLNIFKFYFLILNYEYIYIYIYIYYFDIMILKIDLKKYYFNIFLKILSVPVFCFFSLTWVSRSAWCTSTNPTGPEVNDHVSLQWLSYEQPQGLNLRPQREQTSWSQAFTTGRYLDGLVPVF